MAVSKWILIAIVLSHIGSLSDALGGDDVPTYFLENCGTVTEVKLHKDKPNDIVRIRLFKDFPENPRAQCQTIIYVLIEEFHKAWYTRTLSQRLSNYKVMVTLEDLDWPPSMCDAIFGVVEDMHRNASTMCNELAENLFNYRFDLTYRRFMPLEKDFDLDMTVAVAYMPYGSDSDGCPSNDFFQCASDSLCIPSRFWCDTISHCSDDSDEKDCEVPKRPPTVIDASPEEADPVLSIGELTSSSEDYSSEENIETVAPTSAPSTTSTVRIVTTSRGPTMTRQGSTTTTLRPTTPTVSSQNITKPSSKKKLPTVTKPATSDQKPQATMKTTPKPTTTTSKSTTTTPKSTTTTPKSTTTTPKPTTTTPKPTSTPMSTMSPAMSPARTLDDQVKTPPVTKSISITSSSTVTSATTSKAAKSEESSPGPTQTLVHFSFTERPSIIVIQGASGSEPTSAPTTPRPREAVTQASSKIPETTIGSDRVSSTSSERLKDLYKIEAIPLDFHNEIESTASTAVMNSRTSSSSSRENKPPYPWSDRYDSRSRGSAAPGSQGAPKQWVIVVLCLVLVFIYFFL